MPWVSKPSCTKGIIVSSWLICYIQCGFTSSYLSILGTVSHDRCNIYQICTFFVLFQCPMSCCAFHLFKRWQRGWKVVGRSVGVIIIYFKILACLISQCLWTSFLFVFDEIYYHYYQHLHYDCCHCYCYGYYLFIHTVSLIIQLITK